MREFEEMSDFIDESEGYVVLKDDGPYGGGDETVDRKPFLYYDERTDATSQDTNEEDVDELSAMVEYVKEEDSNGLEEAFERSEGNVEAMSPHTLLLRVATANDGSLVESYYCLQCDRRFASIEDYTQTHGGVVTIANDVEDLVEVEEDVKEDVVAGEQLWELVGDPEEQVGSCNNNATTLGYEIHFLKDQVEEEEEEEQEVENAFEETTPEGADVKVESAAYEADTERYFCCKCNCVFPDLVSAGQHDCPFDGPRNVSDTNPVTEYSCAYCNEPFNSCDELKVHSELCGMKTSSADDASSTYHVFHCQVCNRDLTSLRAFNTHSRSHKRVSNGKPEMGDSAEAKSQQVSCHICNTVFTSEKNFKLHMKIHNKRVIKSIQDALPAGAQSEYNELNQFYCEICNKSFDQNLLAIHKNMHQNVEEYNCSRCNRQFENLPSYEIHLQMHAENPSNRHFPKRSKRAADGKIMFPCQYCGREFIRPYEKVRHERIHTGEKPYECEVCGKTFRVSYSLTLHLRTHTDIRPFVCPTCNKRFKSQPVYAHHLRTHLSERPYKCDMCPKTFRTSVQLCGHKNSHRKPFNCTECNRPFASLYAVKIHMKTHNKLNKSNENLRHRCGICGAVYARPFALRFHMKEQHSLEMDAQQLLQLQNGNIVNDDDDDEEEEEEDSITETEMDCGDLMEDTDLVETRAATQTILKTDDDIIVDNLHAEEIVASWLIK